MSEHGGVEEEGGTEISVLLVCIVIALMLLVKIMDRRLPINSNATIFLAGAGLALATSEVDCSIEKTPAVHWEVGACALSSVRSIDAEVFVLVLLPALIYESSSSVDWYAFRRGAHAIAYLAIPGVLIAAFLHAIAFILMGADWTFGEVVSIHRKN